MKKFSLNGSCLSNSINFERSILRSFSLLFFITLIALCNVSHAQADETISCLEDLETPSFDADLECELESESIFSSETGAATSECVFSTAFGDGDDWALWIPNQDGLGSDDFVPTTSLSFTQYADGTANLSGQVENSSNDQEILLLDFWFENAQDWTDWSDQGRYYKDDAGLAGNNFLDWTYYELVADASHAVGANALLGDVLHFSHNPADYFFGFQLGEGANNKNANYGFSGWFYYTGTLYGEEVSGNGDINADGECVQLVDEGCVHDTEFTYVYTATDACGNIYLEEYIVQVLDEIAPVFTDGPEDMEVSCEDWPLPLADCVAIDNCEGEVTYVEPTESTEAGNCPAELIVTRTWGAIDACGNTATHTQTITVVDNVAPALSNLPSEEITVECDAIPDAADVQASDNCSTFDLDYMTSTEEGDCPNSYTIIRTWSAEDACGNFSSFTQTINVEDTEAPVISLEQLISVECSETENIFASASDNCSDEDAIEIVYTDVLNSGGCMGVLERVYTATDECGNSSEATQYITITDTTAPEMECAPNAEYECSDDYPSAQEDAPEVSDNCSEVTLSLEESTEEGTCLTTITRVWTAEDYCGNTTTCTQVITLVDTTDPEFTSFPEDLTFSCEDEIPAPVNPEADDNCGEVTISLTSEEEAGECDGEYTLSRIFRAEDECGNFTIGVQTLTITDDIAPLFTFVPEDLTLECTDEVPAVNAQAEDTCSEATVSYTDSEEGDSCELVITRTFTAVDACGNESTTSQTIVILDTEAPTFQGPNSIDMPCDVELPNTTISASDLCNSVELEYTDQMVSGGCAGQIIRTFTATDLCGNEASMQQIIDLFDNSNPEFTAFPIDVTVECDEATPVSQMVDATDNCSEVVIEYLGQEIEEGDCPHNFTIIRTWSATDACDNETLRSQTITVEDTTAPEVTAPADLSHECDETPDYGMAQATDNCGEVTISISEETTGDGCETILTRTFTATDECGNSSEAEQLITIVDTTAPYFTFIPQDLTHQCDEQPAYGMAQGDDNCNEFTISVSTEESGDNCETILTRTFTITDACDNSTQATQTITIVDTEAPELDGENVLEIDCDELDAETSVIVTDNCNAATVELIYEDVFVSGGCTGQVIRTWTAIDECGNESEEFVQILDLVDNQNPEVLSQPADLTLECTENVPMSAPEFTDNCDEELSIIFSESSTGDSCEEVITRTWIASDDCGNETIVGQTITILDTEAPVITDVPQGFSHSCDESPEYGSIIAVDACNEVSISVEESTSGDACESTLTRVHTATDACGNSAEYVQIITIFDDEAPVFTFVPAAIEHSCDESPEYGMATATDNCNGANISVSQETLAQDDCTTVIERTFTATDACGNETEASQLITISDDEAPTFNNMPSDVTVQCEAPALALVTADDNCSNGIVSHEVTSDLDECGNGTMTVTYFAEDACGNQAQPISYTITIEDTTDPVLSGLPADLVLDCEDDVPAAANVTVTDNCDENIELDYSEEFFGDVPAEGSIADCVLSTPAGPTCDNNELWSLRLFSFPGYEFFSTVSASLVEYPDGTALITGTVVANNNPDASFDIHVALQDGMDWSDWSDQDHPTSFKDDCEVVTTENLDWTYYIINADDATLTGTAGSDLEGSEFTLTQAPSNLYYGYQVGVSANNVNQNYGNGGWFTAEGTLIDASTDTELELSGISGDFAFDADCCPQYEIERTWTATDCSGNSVSFTQTITFDDLGEQDVPSVEITDDFSTSFANTYTKVYPNPVVGNANFEFKTYSNDKVSVQIYNLNGSLIDTVFEGDAEANYTYTLEYNTSELKGGVYIFKVSGSNGISTEKFVITK